jgi:hypothetical protein
VTDIKDHNDPFAGFEGKLEPDCTTCSDERFLIDLTGETGTANCPHCNPTNEQVNAATAAHLNHIVTNVIEEDPF